MGKIYCLSKQKWRLPESKLLQYFLLVAGNHRVFFFFTLDVWTKMTSWRFFQFSPVIQLWNISAAPNTSMEPVPEQCVVKLCCWRLLNKELCFRMLCNQFQYSTVKTVTWKLLPSLQYLFALFGNLLYLSSIFSPWIQLHQFLQHSGLNFFNSELL